MIQYQKHNWTSHNGSCSCGNDTVICQGCAKEKCSSLTTWIEKRGNVCFQCLSTEPEPEQKTFSFKKVWTEEDLVRLIQTKDDFVGRCLVKLLERQTQDEEDQETTHEKNGVGFSAYDAEIMTSMAKQVKTRKVLSQRQIEFARKRLVHYRRQLTEIANHSQKG